MYGIIGFSLKKWKKCKVKAEIKLKGYVATKNIQVLEDLLVK